MTSERHPELFFFFFSLIKSTFCLRRKREAKALGLAEGDDTCSERQAHSRGETLREAVWSQIPERARLQGSELVQFMGPWQTHQVVEQRAQPRGF